jgi:hypothetical protein
MPISYMHTKCVAIFNEHIKLRFIFFSDLKLPHFTTRRQLVLDNLKMTQGILPKDSHAQKHTNTDMT